MSDPYAESGGKGSTLRKVPPTAEDKLAVADAGASTAGPPQLSEETKAGVRYLEAQLARQVAAERQAKTQSAAAASASTDAVADDVKAEEPTRVHPSLEAIRADFFYANTPVDNIHVRAKIEAALPEFDLDDVLFADYLEQTVVILEGRLTVRYRTMRKGDTDWIDSQALLRFTNRADQVNFIQNARLVFQVVAIEGARTRVPMPESVFSAVNPQQVDKDAFNAKYRAITGMKEAPLLLVSTNLRWFNSRVENASIDELLKNI